MVICHNSTGLGYRYQCRNSARRRLRLQFVSDWARFVFPGRGLIGRFARANPSCFRTQVRKVAKIVTRAQLSANLKSC